MASTAHNTFPCLSSALLLSTLLLLLLVLPILTVMRIDGGIAWPPSKEIAPHISGITAHNTFLCLSSALLFSTLLLLLLVLPILTVMRIDGGIAWPWPAVLTPLWFADAVLVAMLVAGGARRRDEGGGGRWRHVPRLTATHLYLLLLFTFEVLAAVKLNQPRYVVWPHTHTHTHTHIDS